MLFSLWSHIDLPPPKNFKKKQKNTNIIIVTIEIPNSWKTLYPKGLSLQNCKTRNHMLFDNIKYNIIV